MELELDDLVDLFCTSTYGSYWLTIRYNKDDYFKSGLADDNDCRENAWAKVLLSGKSIEVYDYYADGEHYGNLPFAIEKEDRNCVHYTVTLENIKEGLQRAIDGDFKYHDGEKEYMKECATNLINANGDMDLPQAENLMQIILFNELIYG